VRKEKTDRLLRLLQNKRNTIKHRDEWLSLGLALHAGYAGTRWEFEAMVAWVEFSARWEATSGTKRANFEENAQRVWDDAQANRRGGVGPATANMILSKLPDLPDVTIEPVIPAKSKKERSELSSRSG
jgi:hypothetical protein